MSQPHPSFRLLRTQFVESLNITVEEYEHLATGAQHIHLASDNVENVFLVALRTVPEDSTGVAHILEHTALCGSKKYPVRDPFFMMTRRSLNTFMNAFTSSDWTAYPFASVNRKDFNNLMDVYLDAVFFSRLHPLDFAQEGHRLEFEKHDDPQSPLEFKGVVFNEMKGAMSSVNSQLWQILTKYLFPNNTYHFNSGGDPENIPQLSYEQLVTFYKTHYHPSNAIFMTYGDIAAEVHQKKFETQALSHFERLDERIEVEDAQRYAAPIRVEEHYPLDEDSLANKTHIVCAWLLGHSTNLEEALTAHLLSSVLLDNSASPLMHCLETTDLGQSPSPLCGMDDSQKEILFMCGLAGSERKHADEVEKLIIGQLETLVAEGIPKADIDAALHQLELQQREVGGGGYPYGLQLILNALTAATHRGDSAGLLDVDAILASLRIKLEDPNFFPAVIDKLLIKNRHRVTLVLSPDKQMQQVKEAAGKTKLEKIRGSLTEKQQKEIIEQSKALLKRQEQVDDDSILPKVTLADVDKNETFKPPKFVKTLPSNPLKLTAYDAGTNGIVYQQIVSKLPDLSENELDILPIYSALLTEVGIGSKNYLDAQKWQAQVTGGLSAFSSFRGDAKTAETLHSYVGISGKALNRNHAALCDIMQATLEDARFDEGERILELVSQIRMSREQSITGNGHSLAMQAASQGISPAAQISFRLGGLKSISRVKILDDQLKNKSALEELIQTLQSLHSKIRRSNHQILLIGEDHNIADYEKNYSSFVQSLPGSDSDGIFDTHFSSVNTQDAWLTNTQVNFCAHAYPTVNTDHSDAAALLVLSNVLRNGFLHRAIREQGGAYGGGASQDNSAGVFRFYSYRDPRLKDTLNDFRESINWLLETKHKWQAIEEAILGVVSSLDKPDSPAGSAKRDFHAELSGRSPEIRQRFRDRLLQVNEETIKAVAEKYLANQAPNICVITDKSKKADIEQLGLNLNTL